MPHRSTLQALLVVLLLAFPVVGAFAAYFYVYTANNEVYLEQRNYRVLATVGREISSRIEGVATAWKNAVDTCDKAGVETCIDDKLKSIPELKRHNKCGPPGDAVLPDKIIKKDAIWLATDNDGTALYLRSEVANPLCARLMLSKIARTSLAKTFFDDYVLTDKEGNILFREQDRNWGEPRLDPLPRGSAAGGGGSGAQGAPPSTALFALQEPLQGERAAEKYLRFSQPMRFSLGGVDVFWLVHGHVRKDLFESQAWEISPTIVSGLLLVVATLLLGWPMLRLWLLGPREKFQAIDVYVLILSFLFGVGLLATFALDTYAYRAVAAERFDASLRYLANEIAKNFDEEVRRSHAILTEFASSNFANDSAKPVIAPGTLGSYPYFVQLIRADSSGKMLGRWTVQSGKLVEEEAPTATIADRSYFQNAMSDRLFWQFSTKTGFAAEMVRSKLNGQQTFVLAVPTEQSKGKPRGWKEVALISIPLMSLIDPVMPYGFGFAVADQSGKVVVHRQEQRSGQENIVEECEGDSQLAAALETQRVLLKSLRYYGRPYRFYVRRLENTPWSLIVFRTREPLQTANAAILQVSVALFALYLAGPAICFLLSRRRYRADWLWPRRDFTDVYALGSAALMITATVLFAVIECADAWPRLLLLTAAPVLCWCFLHLLLAPRSRGRAVAAWAGPAASGSLIVAAAFMSRSPSVSVALAVAVLAACVGVAIRCSRRRSARVQRKEWAFRAAYASLLTLVCVMVAVGPATVLFRDAFDQGMIAFIRYGQFQHLDALAKRADRVYQLYQDEPLRGGTPESRLLQGLDVYHVPLYGLSPPDRSQSTADRPIRYLSQGVFPLLPSYRPAVGRMGLLVEPTDDDKLATWKSDLVAGSKSLRLEITDAALRARLRGIDPSLQADLPEILPTTPGKSMAALILGLAVGIGALGLLISAVVRRMFLLDADVGLAGHRVPASHGSVLATWTAVHRARQVGEGVRTIDLSSLYQASDCAALFTKNDPGVGNVTPGVVIVGHLETRSDSDEWSRAKLALIERLLFEPPFTDKVSIVLLSHANLMQLWSAQPKQPPAGAAVSPSPEQSTASRWAELMRSFTGEWVYLPQSQPYFAEVLDATVADSVAAESLPFTEPWGSAACYHNIWSTILLEEKLALVHLATEGLLNPGMLGAVTSLMQRGVLVRNPALCFAHKDFAKFVAGAKDDPSLVAWRQTAPRSDWEKLRTPGLILLAVVIAFLYTTQRGVWDSTSALIAAITGGVPTILKFLGLFSRDGAAASKPASTT